MRGLIALLLMVVRRPGGRADSRPRRPPRTADPALTARVNELIGDPRGDGRLSTPISRRLSTPRCPKEKLDAVIASSDRRRWASRWRSTRSSPPAPFTAYLRVKFERGIVNAPARESTPRRRIRSPGCCSPASRSRATRSTNSLADFRALPGASGFAIYALGDGAPQAGRWDRAGKARPARLGVQALGARRTGARSRDGRAQMERCRAGRPGLAAVGHHAELARGQPGHAADAGDADDLDQRQYRDRHAGDAGRRTSSTRSSPRRAHPGSRRC